MANVNLAGASVDVLDKVGGIVAFKPLGGTDTGDDDYIFKTVSRLDITQDSGNFSRHRYDDGLTFYKKTSDEIGTFTVDMYGALDYVTDGLPATPTTAQRARDRVTIGNWRELMVDGRFPELTITVISQAANSAEANNFIKTPYSARLLGLQQVRSETEGIEDWVLTGVITDVGDVTRQDDDTV